MVSSRGHVPDFRGRLLITFNLSVNKVFNCNHSTYLIMIMIIWLIDLKLLSWKTKSSILDLLWEGGTSLPRYSVED